MAGLLEALPDFAIAMDAFLFGARRAMEIHLPTCSTVSSDEATLVALCGLAQDDYDGPLLASLDVMMAPTASRVALLRAATACTTQLGQPRPRGHVNSKSTIKKGACSQWICPL